MAENTPTPEGKEQSQPAGEVNAQALLETLNKMHVTEPEQLEGKFNALKEYGNMTRILGEVRNENAELKEMLHKMQSQPVQKVNFEEGQTLNLGDEIRRNLRAELDAKERETFERQQKIRKEVSEAVITITNDEDYPHVQKLWESKMTPETIFRINNGQLNPIKLYQDTVRSYYREIAKQSRDVILNLTGKGKVAAPHVEQGEQVPTNLVSGTHSDPNAKEIEKFTAQVNKGKLPSDEEYVEIFQKFFPRRPPQK